MGWAKYYEDNVSICIGRMVVKEYITAKSYPVGVHDTERRIEKTSVRPAAMNKEAMIRTSFEDSMRNGRKGIELSFL